jgi:hypothetical protein
MQTKRKIPCVSCIPIFAPIVLIDQDEPSEDSDTEAEAPARKRRTAAQTKKAARPPKKQKVQKSKAAPENAGGEGAGPSSQIKDDCPLFSTPPLHLLLIPHALHKHRAPRNIAFCLIAEPDSQTLSTRPISPSCR